MGAITSFGAFGPATNSPGSSGLAGRELSADDLRQVAELKKRDQEVRQHEQAHVAAGGRYVRGGPRYTFTTGPDGKRYATGGSVDIDTSPESTPEATIAKAQVVRRAALAPAQPSPQDRAVAAEAEVLERDARRELRESGEASGSSPIDAATTPRLDVRV